jgi:polyhydroxybutyrate depolymerase
MTRVLASLLLLAATSCSTHNAGVDPQHPDAAADAAAGEPPTPDAADIKPTTCTGKSKPPLDATKTIMFGGLARTYDVHVPASYDPTHGTALILNFHGYTSNSSQEAFLSKMNPKSDAAGYIVVYPQGTGSTTGWNAGACCGEAASKNVDDVGFVGAMLDALEADLCIDPHRVFATGMSNGGFLSHRLACELADRIAAVAPVAGVLGIPTCTPSRPISVMHFHGTADNVVPYAGSANNGFAGVVDTWNGWATRDQCTDEPTVSFEKGDSKCQAHTHCAGGAEVILCTVDGGGHTWPGGFPIPTGKTTTDLDASDAMWAFFQRHPLP